MFVSLVLLWTMNDEEAQALAIMMKILRMLMVRIVR